jgi:hypothetical protein
LNAAQTWGPIPANVNPFPEQEEALSNTAMSTASTTTVLEYCRPMSTVNNNITLLAITSTREKLLLLIKLSGLHHENIIATILHKFLA